MKIVPGLLAGLAGAAVGFGLAAIVALAMAKAANVSAREGAHGYLAILAGMAGGLAGLAAGVAFVARTAPEGERLRAAGAIGLGFVGLAVAAGLVAWGWVSLREDALEYGGSQASLELEFRLPREKAPAGAPSAWLDVEVHTSSTRPAGTVLSSGIREEGGMLVVPVSVAPLIRSSGRLVVARLRGLHTELFDPRLRRKPNPKAGWTEWRRADSVDVPGSSGPASPDGVGILELRARVRVFGE